MCLSYHKLTSLRLVHFASVFCVLNLPNRFSVILILNQKPFSFRQKLKFIPFIIGIYLCHLLSGIDSLKTEVLVLRINKGFE